MTASTSIDLTDFLDEPALKATKRLHERTLGIVGALGLLIGLSPFLGVVGLMVFLTSKGPVIYRQARVGKGGGEFQVWKVRTMQSGAQDQQTDCGRWAAWKELRAS